MFDPGFRSRRCARANDPIQQRMSQGSSLTTTSSATRKGFLSSTISLAQLVLRRSFSRPSDCIVDCSASTEPKCGHFVCHVFHQDDIVAKAGYCEEIEHAMRTLLDPRSAERPRRAQCGASSFREARDGRPFQGARFLQWVQSGDRTHHQMRALDVAPSAFQCDGRACEMPDRVRWSPLRGQFGGFAKLGSGVRYAAMLMPSQAVQTSSGVLPPKAECGLVRLQ